LERNGKLYPIEVKATSSPTRKDARGLQAFRTQHPHLNVQKGLVIAPTTEKYYITDKDLVIPWNL